MHLRLSDSGNGSQRGNSDETSGSRREPKCIARISTRNTNFGIRHVHRLQIRNLIVLFQYDHCMLILRTVPLQTGLLFPKTAQILHFRETHAGAC
jgi:hypothetical protein